MEERRAHVYTPEGVEEIGLVEMPGEPGTYTNVDPITLREGDFLKVEGAPGTYSIQFRSWEPPAGFFDIGELRELNLRDDDDPPQE
jgi:hypothetical protein